MELVIFSLAVGVIELLVGIPLLLRTERAMQWMRKLMEDVLCLQLLSGAFLIVALVPLVRQPSIGWDIPGILRFFALVAVVKGVMISWFPHIAVGMVRERFFAKPQLVTLIAIGMCITGLMFLAAGISVMPLSR